MFANLASQKDRDAKPNKGKWKYLPGSERLAEDENAERHDKNRRQILDKTQNAQRQAHGTDRKSHQRNSRHHAGCNKGRGKPGIGRRRKM